MSKNTVASNAAAIAGLQATLSRLVSMLEGQPVAPVAPVAPVVAAPLSVPASLTADIAAPVQPQGIRVMGTLTQAHMAAPAPRAVAPRAGRSCCPGCQTPLRNLTRANVVVRSIPGAQEGTVVPPFTGTAFLKALPAVPVQLRDGRQGTIAGEALYGILSSRRVDPTTGKKARNVTVPGFLRGESTHPDVTLMGGPILRSETDDELSARVFGG